MPPGDVQGRLRLDTRQFNSGLTAGMRRLEQFGETAVAVLTRVQQVATATQDSFKNIRLPEIRPNVTVNIRDTGVRTYKAEVDSASVSVAGLSDRTDGLGNSAQGAKPKLEGAGAGAKRLGSDAAGAVPQIDRLQDGLDRLQQVGALLVTGAGVLTFFKRLDTSAQISNTATVGLNLFNRELVKGNELGTDGQRMLDGLAARFKINSSAIAGDAAGILRYGANLEQTNEILLRAGASAVIRGRAFSAGSNAATEALNGEFSAALNLIGVSGNLSTYFQREAKARGVAVDQLTRQQKVEAFLALLRAETQTEVEALTEVYVGYGAALQRVNTSQTTAAQDTGSVAIPALTLLKNTYADLLDLYSALPRPVQALAVGTAALSVVAGGLVVGYVALRSLLLNQRTLGPVILDLLRNETVARSSVGRSILLQARAYGLLDREQTKSALASRQAALAATASATSVGRVRGALSAPVRGGFLIGLGSLVAFLKEASSYVAVFTPLVQRLDRQISGTNTGKLTSDISELTKAGALLQAVFSQGVLLTLAATARTASEVAFQVNRADLLIQRQAARLGGHTERVEDANRALAENRRAYEETNDEILNYSVNTFKGIEANYLATIGLQDYTTSTVRAADGTRKLTSEAQGLRDSFAQRFEALRPEVDTTTLSAQVEAATQEIDALIKELRTEVEKLEPGDLLRGQLEGLLRGAQELRRGQVGKLYADALREAQEQADTGTIAAMQEGAARVEAQRASDLNAARRAFDDRVAGLREGGGRYNAFLDVLNQETAAINARANAELEQDARQRLESARNLREQIDQVGADLAAQQTGSSDDALTRVRGQFAQNAQQIRSDTQKLLRDVERALQERVLSEEEASAEVQRIGRLQSERLTQNQRELTSAVQEEVRRRTDFITDHNSAVSALEAAREAERRREQGDDLGAIQTELTERLRLIDGGLRRELQTEGLTRAQITALSRRAEADRVQARVEAERQIESIMQDEVTRERTFRNELRAVQQQGEIGAAQDAGKERAAAAAEQEGILADLRVSLEQELAAVGLSEDEKVDIRALNRAKVEMAESTFVRKLAGFAEAEAETVAAAQREAARARTEAIEGNLPRMIRQFGLEQEARLKTDREALDDFEGTFRQRQQIVASQGQREMTLTKQFAGQLLKEQRSALEAYQTAFLKAESEMLSAREEAAAGALAAAQKVTDFSANRTRAFADRGALAAELGAYEALQKTLDDTVARSARLVSAARQRAFSARATADDVGALIAAENDQVAAQGRVVDATQAQIDRLEALRQKQFDIVRGGSDALALFDEASKITGLGDVVDVTPFLLQQKDALVQLLRQQDALNAPTNERLETVRQLSALQERMKENGWDLGDLDKAFINQQALEAIRDYPSQARDALEASRSITDQISALESRLSAAQSEYAKLLGNLTAAATVDLQVRVDVRQIRAGLEEAQKALAQVFGTEAAARISERFAAGFSLDEVLKREMASAAGLVQAEADRAGAGAGAGLMSAFAAGIDDNSDLVVQAVIRSLTRVRELLPSSDAKRGPLSDLTRSGGKFVTTFGGGIERSLPSLQGVVTRMAQTVKPVMSVQTSMALPGFAGAGGGDQTNHFHLGDAPFQPDAIAEQHGRVFAESALRTVRNHLQVTGGRGRSYGRRRTP